MVTSPRHAPSAPHRRARCQSSVQYAGTRGLPKRSAMALIWVAVKVLKLIYHSVYGIIVKNRASSLQQVTLSSSAATQYCQLFYCLHTLTKTIQPVLSDFPSWAIHIALSMGLGLREPEATTSPDPCMTLETWTPNIWLKKISEYVPFSATITIFVTQTRSLLM